MSEKQSLANFVERAYLDYSMYVVLDRALPHIADGFKPVQRRIVYAMSELGLSYTSKHKKAARTVGDVLGKFHPHGDSACYEAMVLMAQPFSYRYPLVDGQGNWGAMDDPKSFAAMRYTEARLTHYAQCFLREVQMGTVEWIPNFDGALLEPKTLPARLPNVLLNGAMGIAVGIATDIPPHNVAEVVDACCLLLDEPHSQLDDLLTCIQGPDFPCGGQLINSASQLREIYATGKGILRLRARYQVDDHEPIIRIIELPYQVSINRVMEQISGQIEAKKLPQIIDIRDESDQQNPVMLVLVLRNKRVDCDAIMNHLFASTDLEKTQRCNLTLIGTDNRPRTMDLHSLLVQWLNYRRDTLQKRLTHRIEKVLQRLHILDGLLIAFLSIDEVIAIIRTEDDPKHHLMMRFALSDEQAEAILQLRLRYIAKLEEIQLRAEQDQLNDERYFLETHLRSSTKLDALLRSELVEDANTFADKRRTFIQPASDAKAFDEEQAIIKEAVTVVLSKQGWIRSARGHEIDPNNLSYKSSDSLWRSVRTYTNEQLVIIDRTGRSYSIGVHQLPSARGQGEPLSSKLEITDLADIPILCAHPKEQHELLVNNKGYGFIVTNKELRSRNKAGKAVIKLDDNAQIFAMLPCQLQDAPLVALITTSGYLLIIALAEVPQLARGKGVKLINIPPKAAKQGETLAGVCICRKSESLRIGAGKRHYTITPDNWQGYISARAKRGKRLPVGLQNPNNISVVA